MERVGDDEDHGAKARQGALVDSIECGQRGALVAHADGDETLPRSHDHLDQCGANRRGITGKSLQRPGHDMGGAQRHGHVDQRLDRGRMVAHAAQRRRAVVAAQHRRDRRQLQLGRDRAHRADRRIDQLDRQIDGSEEADAGDTAGDPRQQPPQRGRRRPGGDDHDDLTKSIVALQLSDRCRCACGDVSAGSHPTHGHLAPAMALGRPMGDGLRTHGDHLCACIVPDGCHAVAEAYIASASRTEQVVTPISSTTAASHGGRTTAATAIGSSRPDDSTAMRTNKVA